MRAKFCNQKLRANVMIFARKCNGNARKCNAPIPKVLLFVPRPTQRILLNIDVYICSLKKFRVKDLE